MTKIYIRNGCYGTGRSQQEGWMEITDLQQVHGEWCCAVFPNATNAGALAHLKREVEEFLESEDPSEAADIVLLLMSHANINKYDLLAEVCKKIQVNRSRKWPTEPNDEGFYEHIK